MATTNIWKQFASLLPSNIRTIVTIISNDGNGKSTAELRDGTIIIINGESVSPPHKALVENGEIKYQLPDFDIVQRNV
ncbi:hypothetical protein GCM10023116_04930 [Kistimonas scapharcae]|uniref:Uncharacterized protein n=1 Tax=Kistimonas scapharcae TaxID=1036133 RepID=A0ABP8UXG3_9GAMM